MNILLTSVTSDQVQAEVRVPNGHRLKTFNLNFKQQEEYSDWCLNLYRDSSLDIGSHYTSFPLQRVQVLSIDKREQAKNKWGEQLRFFQLHNHPNEVLAYSSFMSHKTEMTNQVAIYEVPFLSLFVQEWFGSASQTHADHTALLYVSSQQAALSLFSNAHLINQAVIPFRTAEDLLYHFLFSLDQFDIAAKSCTVHIVGPESANESIVKLFTEQTALDQDFFRNPEDPLQFDLKLLWKCAS